MGWGPGLSYTSRRARPSDLREVPWTFEVSTRYIGEVPSAVLVEHVEMCKVGRRGGSATKRQRTRHDGTAMSLQHWRCPASPGGGRSDAKWSRLFFFHSSFVIDTNGKAQQIQWNGQLPKESRASQGVCGPRLRFGNGRCDTCETRTSRRRKTGGASGSPIGLLRVAWHSPLDLRLGVESLCLCFPVMAVSLKARGVTQARL